MTCNTTKSLYTYQRYADYRLTVALCHLTYGQYFAILTFPSETFPIPIAVLDLHYTSTRPLKGNEAGLPFWLSQWHVPQYVDHIANPSVYWPRLDGGPAQV